VGVAAFVTFVLSPTIQLLQFMPVKIFIVYAREDQTALNDLKAHLRPLEKRGDVQVWYDGEILPGEKWDDAIKHNLETADMVLLFISKSFFNSEYIEQTELKKALERHRTGQATVIPIIVKPCYWEANEDIAALQVLPKEGKPVSSWADSDEAFTDVVRGVQRLLNATKERKLEVMKIAIKKVEEGVRLYDQKKYKEAFELLSTYLPHTDESNVRALAILASIYDFGSGGILINPAEAVRWYLKAANLGHASSQFNLAISYRKGEGVEKNFVAAVKWAKLAADQGHAGAQGELGLRYEMGEGISKNLDEAVKWYKMSAAQGNPVAQNNLADMYEYGKGVEKNLETAISWYRKAAEQGQESAIRHLKRLGYSI
jgi:uncharacterized protein